MQTEVTCYAYKWFEKIDDIDGSTSVNAWCLTRDDPETKDNHPVLLRFEGFTPNVYIELPMYIERRRHRWSKEDAQLVYDRIAARLEDNKPVSCKSGLFKTLYRGNVDFPMLKLEFRNKTHIVQCERMLNRPLIVPELGEIICKVWHNKIDTIRQFLTNRKCKYSQWFTVKALKVHPADKISTLEREYISDYQNLEPIDPDITKSWSGMPHELAIDIEVYTDNHNAMPIRTMNSHVAYMISCIYQKIGRKDTRKKYLIILGDCDDLKVESNIEVIRVSDEAELCYSLCDLIHKHDPEVMSGYNILGFDYPYLNARLDRLVKSWDQKASRLIGVNPELIVPKKWESKAYGFTENYFLEFPGRISIDMLPIIRRGHKLPKYDLDTVGNAFLKRGKHDIKPIQMFIYYEEFMNSKKLLERCIKEWVLSLIKADTGSFCAFSAERTNKGQKEWVNLDHEYVRPKIRETGNELLDALIEKNKESFCGLYPVFHSNISHKILINVLKKYSAAKENITKVGRYCIEDSELVVDLIDKTAIWIGLVELSNVVGVSLVDTYSRGQQIRGMSQAYDLLEPLGVVIDYKPPASNIKYSGGFVAEPNPGTYDFVITLDFTSLYPSIMMAYNICMSTYLYPGDETSLVDGVDYTTIKCPIYDDNGDNIIGYNVHRFLKKHIREGYIPRLVRNLVDNRKVVKAKMGAYLKSGGHEDDLECMTLNEQQLARKISANSLYGLLGVRERALLPFLQGAESVTAIGREKIQFCNKYLEDKYKAKIVYNDTDSTMFVLPFVDNYTDAIEWGKKLEKELTATMERPMALEMEKVGRMLCIKKKKYAYWTADIAKMKRNKETGKDEVNPGYGKLKDYHEDPNSVLAKGVILARRDNCKLLRDTYREMMYSVLDGGTLKGVLSKLMKECINLYRGEVQWQSLCIIRSLGSNYKSDSYFMHVFGEELKAIGKPAAPGDRLEYIICEGNGLLGQRLRLPDTYLERLSTDKEDKIDYRYYLEKLFIKGLEQLWSVGFKKELDELALKYQQEDNLSIIREMEILSKKDKGAGIRNLWNYYNGDVDQIIKWLDNPRHSEFGNNELIHKYLFNKYVKSRQSKVSGRSVFNPRITATPIKMLLKAIDMDKLEDYCKVVLSDEDFKELFPNVAK